MEIALPFDEVDFDPSSISDDVSNLSVEQYLSWVRYQAQSMPTVSRACIDSDSFKKNQTAYMPHIEDIESCPIALLPTIEWENDVLSSFSDLRLALGKYAECAISKERKILVPPLKDRDAWLLFCFGDDNLIQDVILPMSQQSSASFAPAPAPAYEDDIPCDRSDDGIEEDENEEQSEGPLYPEWDGDTNVAPSTSIILQFDQVLTQRLLEHHIAWLENVFLSSSRGRWIYALLARLEKPLHRDTVAMIRQLYRTCCKQRRMLAEVPEIANNPRCELAVVNTLISICGLYFGQAESDRSHWVDKNHSIASIAAINAQNDHGEIINIHNADWGEEGDSESQSDVMEGSDNGLYNGSNREDGEICIDDEDGLIREVEEGEDIEDVELSSDIMELIESKKRTVQEAGFEDDGDMIL